MKWIPKFRFSLRTLFIVTTLLGAGLVPLVVRLEKARQQKEAVAWVLEHGGTVYYRGGPELNSTKDITLTPQATDPFGGTLVSNDPFSSSTSNPTPVPPNVSWLEGLLGTDFFYHVFKLELQNCWETDISPIRHLTHLEDLDLSGTHATDLKPLANSKSLKSLDLGDTEISDLSPLSELQHLEDLSIRNTNVKDLRPLSFLSNLRIIDLGDTKSTDYQPLAKLKSLRSIDLSGSGISDLSPLSELENLVRINIADTKVKDLRPLANLSQLGSIDLSYSAVTDISPLANNSRVEDLSLGTVNLPTLSIPVQGPNTLAFKWRPDNKFRHSIVTEFDNCYIDFSPLFQLKKMKRINLMIPQGTLIDQLKNAMPNCEQVNFHPLGPIKCF
ncbi:MAG: leucine-rich repeat domain-containing protein [Pirellulales bacterium]